MLGMLRQAGLGVQLVHLPEEEGSGGVRILHGETRACLAEHETYQSNRMCCAGYEAKCRVAEELVHKVAKAFR